MTYSRLFAALLLVLLIQGCSKESPKPTLPPTPAETPSKVSHVTPVSRQPGATPTMFANPVTSIVDPEMDDDGVYRFTVGGRITEPRLLKRGEFDRERFIGKPMPGGPVVAEMTIDVDGTVRDVRLLRGVDPEIDAAVLKSAQENLFEPARLNGDPVPVKYILVFRIEVY